MKYTVFDTADDCTSKIAALKKAGITAIIRYDDPSQAGKREAAANQYLQRGKLLAR